MGRRSKQTFHRRRRSNGQKAHEKMLNITNYKRNANQNYNEVSPQPVRMAIIKSLQIGVPIVAQWLTNPTSVHEDTTSVPDLAQWFKDLALLRLWCRAVATVPI